MIFKILKFFKKCTILYSYIKYNMDNKNKKIFKLKNGIKVLIIPIETNLINISLDLLLGSYHENNNNIGITHYMEHLMAKFTSNKYPEHKYIKNKLFDIGATHNAHVSEYFTSFWITGYYKNLEFFIDILSNTIKNFKYDKSIIENEKKAVYQELNNIIDDNDYYFNNKINYFLYKKLAKTLDYNIDISNVKKYNINNIYNYINNKILLDNIVISVSCKKNNIKNTIKLLNKYFNFNKNIKNKLEYPVFNYNNNNMKIIHVKNKKNIYNKNILLKFIVHEDIELNSDKHIALDYLSKLLFNYNGGVFYNLRFKFGYIYYIRLVLDIDPYNKKSSKYYIETSVNSNNIHLFIKELLHIISKLNYTNISKFKYIKNTYNISFENQKFYNLTSYNNYYKQFLLFKKPIIHKKTIHKKIINISKNTILKELKLFKYNLLNKGIIFYYSNKNFNNIINNKFNLKNNIKFLSI